MSTHNKHFYNPQLILDTFLQAQHPSLLQDPAWQKYRDDFITYFTMLNASRELVAFPNMVFYPCVADATASTGIDKYYFYQDTWASRKIFENKPIRVVDIGSTVLYAGIVSQFTATTFVDIRPIDVNLEGLTMCAGSILELPFQDASENFITSLCVLEHIGLGRYGDTIMTNGAQRACAEINRVLKPGGELIISTNIGPPCIAFNAHLIFSQDHFLSYFQNYDILDELYLTPDPAPKQCLDHLSVGEFVVYVVHLRKAK